jgi:hypothetical protein
MKTTIQDLCFDVEMMPVVEKLGLDTISSTEYGIFADVNGNGKQVLLNVCSGNYELLPNASLFPKIEMILKNGGIEFDVEYKMLDFLTFLR